VQFRFKALTTTTVTIQAIHGQPRPSTPIRRK
jgi:hypothetical protein